MGVINGHQASHDFWGTAKLQSALGVDNSRYAAHDSFVVVNS